jgi:hypothetical protein
MENYCEAGGVKLRLTYLARTDVVGTCVVCRALAQFMIMIKVDRRGYKEMALLNQTKPNQTSAMLRCSRGVVSVTEASRLMSLPTRIRRKAKRWQMKVRQEMK